MIDCTVCHKQQRIVELEQEIDNHHKRIDVLENFRDWATPIIKRIENMERDVTSIFVSQKYMSVIFGAFVMVVSYIYSVQIIGFMQEQPMNKVEIIREIHLLDKTLNARVDELKEQVITSSKMNYNTTVKEISKDKE